MTTKSLRIGAWLWLTVSVIVLAAAALSLRDGVKFETNVLRLLPAAQRSAALEQVIDAFSDSLGRGVIIAVSAPTAEQARAAGEDVLKRLRASTVLEVISHGEAELESALLELYFPYRAQLLSTELRRLLTTGDVAAVTHHRMRMLYSPAALPWTDRLRDDPLLLFPSFALGLIDAAGSGRSEGGMVLVSKDEEEHALIFMRLRGSALSDDVQQMALGELAALQELVGGSARLTWTGVLRFASASAAAMKKELTLIGNLSTVALLSLLVLAFGALRPVLLTFASIAFGLLLASAASILVFSELHIITLVFGTTLLGVSIDYGLHYLAERRLAAEQWRAGEALRVLWPGLLLGYLTTLVGYVGIGVAPFPGLRQMAFFSGAGITASFLTVVLWFPFLFRAPISSSLRNRKEPVLYRLATRYLQFVGSSLRSGRRGVAALLVLTAIAAAGIAQLRFRDDIRLLQDFPPTLIEEDRRVRALLPQSFDPARFIVITGETADEVLQRSERVIAGLRALQEDEQLDGFQAVAQFVPSVERQREDAALVAKLAQHRAALEQYAEAVGLPSAAIDNFIEQASSASVGYLSVEDWLGSVVSAPLRGLWLANEELSATFVPLSGVRDSEELIGLVSSVEGAHFVDRVREITEIFAAYRRAVAVFIALSYLVVLAALIWRYGVRGGLWVMVPPVVASLLTFGLAGLVGAAVNLFHLVALLLVLGMGVDYAIFLAEAPRQDAAGTSDIRRFVAMFAIVVSCASTIFSFGFLLLSSLPALRAIGLVMSCGVLFSFLLAPLAARAALARPEEMSRMQTGK